MNHAISSQATFDPAISLTQTEVRFLDQFAENSAEIEAMQRIVVHHAARIANNVDETAPACFSLFDQISCALEESIFDDVPGYRPPSNGYVVPRLLPRAESLDSCKILLSNIFGIGGDDIMLSHPHSTMALREHFYEIFYDIIRHFRKAEDLSDIENVVSSLEDMCCGINIKFEYGNYKQFQKMEIDKSTCKIKIKISNKEPIIDFSGNLFYNQISKIQIFEIFNGEKHWRIKKENSLFKEVRVFGPSDGGPINISVPLHDFINFRSEQYPKEIDKKVREFSNAWDKYTFFNSDNSYLKNIENLENKILNDIIEYNFNNKYKNNYISSDLTGYLNSVNSSTSLDDRLSVIDNYARENPGRPVSPLIVALFPIINERDTHVSEMLPSSAPKTWVDEKETARKNGLPWTYNPPEFIKEVYGKWQGQGLSKQYLRNIDPPLYRALYNWLSLPGNEMPTDLDLPTKAEQTTRWIDKIEQEGARALDGQSVDDTLRHARRLESAKRRREIEK